MNHERASNLSIPAPCLIDSGVVVNKNDMVRLLQDLGQVQYRHFQDGITLSEGQGLVMEVFADGQQATLVANHTLYINVYSFDCLEIGKTDADGNHFDLVQDNRRLRLIPLSDPMHEHITRSVNTAAFEAMVADALSASWDACLDDDRNFLD
ncbi:MULTISPECIES: hypothetical protein [Cyanophyceae]|uniref:hypothetical protein n=1 Tax=Cyanophyceae TaxID=3028117 RepID=UPI0016879E9F|nr:MULTISPECIES: hypothetical protein [Cyanophyceae]MBD1914390.1 hypothetical protein [Phormidium sp. FACHB-77]MBD2029969.1 hypothetical protein [Phormidium sp. FACHB-322]MBD2049947.1 hypothetical protein [Leptolyngbya sp. FACHB-60]